MIKNLVKDIINAGGDIFPLLISPELTNGTGIANPSIFIDKNGKILVNIRHVGYSLYLSENKQLFQTRWGNTYSPFCYLHPEDDCKLRTVNYFLELDKETLQIISYLRVDTSSFDTAPKWDFIGLEDARLVKWNGDMFMCGVRRDTKPNGEGRMELSRVVEGKETSRSRIEPPNDPNSYCEKNWMPILDHPYHFVKWSNPTEVVKVDLETNTSTTVKLSENFFPVPRDIRGGSQVIRVGDKYIAVTHEVDLWQTAHDRKDGRYYHRFVVWDENFEILHTSDAFNFMGAGVEFCCGLAEVGDNFLISFAFQDNAAFVLRVPKSFLLNFLGI